MITGIQVRMARAGLKWSGQQLAAESGVGLSTVKRLEQEDGFPSVRIQNLQSIEKAFLETGRVRFEGEEGVFIEALK